MVNTIMGSDVAGLDVTSPGSGFGCDITEKVRVMAGYLFHAAQVYFFPLWTNDAVVVSQPIKA